MENPSTSPVTSDWPLPLMLDEAWLRAHRGFVHSLEGAGLWSETASQQTFMRSQRDLGEHLRDTVLLEILGREDFACVNTEAIFGASNRRFRRRLPFVLAFGYELGGGFYGALVEGDDARRTQVAETCAIFNLGVSVFDLVSDTNPALFAQVATLFDAKHLDQMLRETRSFGQVSLDAGQMPDAEVRVLLKLIGAFFARQCCLAETDDPATETVRRHLAGLLVAAHGAELRSAREDAVEAVDWVSISEANSTLPCAIMGDLVRLVAMPATSATAMDRLDRVIGHVQTTFWLTDDLADIVRDFQDGALNVLLARSGASVHRQRDPARDYPVLAHLLASRVIEETIEQITEHLGAADIALKENTRNGCTSYDRLRVILKAYTRDWVE